MAGVLEVIWPTAQAKCFCRHDWTGGITMKSLKKLVPARRRKIGPSGQTRRPRAAIRTPRRAPLHRQTQVSVRPITPNREARGKGGPFVRDCAPVRSRCCGRGSCVAFVSVTVWSLRQVIRARLEPAVAGHDRRDRYPASSQFREPSFPYPPARPGSW